MPLCCCSAKAENMKEAAGCCQTEQESGGSEHDPKLCACESHDAKDKPETVRLHNAGATDMIAPDPNPITVPLLRGMTVRCAARPLIIDDPLGDVFARYSRWII
ncbi:MAG: hypothetical protein RLZZ505_1829 [Verrucomicrobiota bacterium]